MKNKKFVTMLGLSLFFNMFSFAGDQLKKILLEEAIKAGDTKALATLLKEGTLREGIDFRTFDDMSRMVPQNERTESAVIFALKNLNKDTYSILWNLLRAGANPNVFDKDGKTALNLALDADRRDLAKMLIEYGADPESQNSMRKMMESKQQDELARWIAKYNEDMRTRRMIDAFASA